MGNVEYMGRLETLITDSRLTLRNRLNMANSCLRYILLISNLLLSSLGLLVIAGGIWLVVDEQSAQNIAEEVANATSIGNATNEFEDIYTHKYFDYFVIGLGAVTVLVSLFGFCGAKQESVCLLSTYIFFTFILLISQIAAIVLINYRTTGIEDFKHKAGEALNIDLEKLEGTGYQQTIFFGVLAGITCIILAVSLCFCNSVRKQKSPNYAGV